MRLGSMKLGQEGVVLKIDVKNVSVKRHLLEMGVIRGTRIKILNIAPMGDPISIGLRGYELAIRKDDARYILVEVLA